MQSHNPNESDFQNMKKIWIRLADILLVESKLPQKGQLLHHVLPESRQRPLVEGGLIPASCLNLSNQILAESKSVWDFTEERWETVSKTFNVFTAMAIVQLVDVLSVEVRVSLS